MSIDTQGHSSVTNGTSLDEDSNSRLSTDFSEKTTDDETPDVSEPVSESVSENPSAEVSPEPSANPSPEPYNEESPESEQEASENGLLGIQQTIDSDNSTGFNQVIGESLAPTEDYPQQNVSEENNFTEIGQIVSGEVLNDVTNENGIYQTDTLEKPVHFTEGKRLHDGEEIAANGFTNSDENPPEPDTKKPRLMEL